MASIHEGLKKFKEGYSKKMTKAKEKKERSKKEQSSCSEEHAEKRNTPQEKELKEEAKTIVQDAIFRAIGAIYTTDIEEYQKKIQKMQRKIDKDEEWRKLHFEREKLMISELANVKRKVVDLRDAKDESNKEKRWLSYKIDALITENAEVHTRYLDEQERRESNDYILKDEIKHFKRERLRLEQCNSKVEKEASDFRTQLKSEKNKIVELEKKVFILKEELSAKQLIIEQFLKEKPRRRFVQRFLGC